MKLRKPHRVRVVLLGVLFAGLAASVLARLHTLQAVRHEHYSTRADKQHFKPIVLQPERGPILDRTGRTLAQSTGRLTVYINPKFLSAPHFEGDRETLARSLAAMTEQTPDVVRARLAAKRPVALIKRTRPEVADRVMDTLDEAGVDGRGFWLHRETIRLYPARTAAAVVGFCSKDEDGDNAGIAGVELAYNDLLKGQKIEGRSPRSALREVLEPFDADDLKAARGATIQLTLDATLQEAAERTIAETIAKHNARSGGAIVMDVRTGAVLAMASLPTFDNNAFGTAPAEALRNRTLTDPLETGSVAKLFTASILMDRGYVTPDSLVDCEGGYAVVDGRRLHDSPGHAPLHVVTFRESLRWSSNVGIVKAAQALENKEWYGYLRAFGFGAPTGIDLPGEGSGILYPVERWTKFSRTSLPMGYEIAMTPIQICAAIAAISNGGNYYAPYLVQEVRDADGNVIQRHNPEPVRQVLRPTTSLLLRELMEDIVSEGTGKKAVVAGYKIGGKTGTTRKSNIFDRREYIASFAGVLPIQDPHLAIYVYIDSPTPDYYASIVAAPAFQAIARVATLQLGIAPTEPVETEEEKASAEVAAAKVAEETAADLSEEPAPVPGAMPDLRGLSMAEARLAAVDLASRLRFVGSGHVADQFPRPGEPLPEGAEVVLHFSPEPAPLNAARDSASRTSNTGATR